MYTRRKKFVDEKVLADRFNVVVRNRFPAKYGLVLSVQNGGGPFILKAPVPQILASMSESERRAEAHRINSISEAFLSELMEYEVPIPLQYLTSVTEDGYPVHMVSDEGQDCATILRENPQRASEVIHGMVAAIANLLAHGTHAAGIDAFLGNFALNGHGVRYIDIFPSYVKYKGKHVLHYPNPADRRIYTAEFERKFTAFGILRRLRLDLMLVDPRLEDEFLKAIGSCLEPDLACEMRERFAALPDQQIASCDMSGLATLLDTLDPMQTDGLREFATRVVKGPAREAIMRQVSSLTRMVESPSVNEYLARVERFKTLMCEVIAS